MNKARAMLDALMGPGRDVADTDTKGSKEKFKDPSVCKRFLVGHCPFDKEALGGKRIFDACDKMHSELMRAQFDEHPEAETLRGDYEKQLLRDLEYTVRECGKHIASEKQRIKEDLRRKKPPLPTHVNDKLAAMKRESSAKITEAEKLDDDSLKEKESLITEAKGIMKERELLQEEETKIAIERVVPEETCEICGVSFTGKDGDAAHLQFRIHAAYQGIREKRAELLPKIEGRRKKDEDDKDKRKEDRDGRSGKERDRDRARDRDRDRDREKNRSRSHGGRGKQKGSDRRNRSRSRDQRRRR